MPDKRSIERFLAIVAALSFWQAASMLISNPLILVTPLTVLKTLGTLIGNPAFWQSISFSFFRIAYGFFLALVAGIGLAALAGRHHLAEVLFKPYMSVVKATPVASFIILCLIWLDSKNLSIFISFLMVLPIIYTNVLHGIQSTDAKLLEMTDLFRVGRWRKLMYIYVPQLKPYLVSACSVSIGMSWKAGIAAEVIGIPTGSIGERLYEAKIYLSSADLFAWTVVIVAISVLFEKMFILMLKAAYVRMERA